MAETASLLATCLLPVVGFLHCSSANSHALHVLKALHGLHMLHGNIRESNTLLTSEAEQICEVIVIDPGHSRLCTPKLALHQELLQTQLVSLLGLSELNRRYLANVTWYKIV